MLKTDVRPSILGKKEKNNSISCIYRGAANLALNPDDPNIFPPDDPWTLSLAEALVCQGEAGILDGKNIVELGVGSGVNMLGLRALALNNFFTNKPTFTGLDITSEAVAACDALAKQYGFREDVALYQSNLLQDVPANALDGTNVVFACLPQVVWDYQVMQRQPESREFADYYIVTEDNRVSEDDYALGLLARALDQIRHYTPDASVLFNIAGRQGDKCHQLFMDHGFSSPEAIVHSVIPHDPGTALTSFVKWEEVSGNSCIFYTDEKGENIINAAEAEVRRVEGESLFHDLSVVWADPVIEA